MRQVRSLDLKRGQSRFPLLILKGEISRVSWRTLARDTSQISTCVGTTASLSPSWCIDHCTLQPILRDHRLHPCLCRCWLFTSSRYYGLQAEHSVYSVTLRCWLFHCSLTGPSLYFVRLHMGAHGCHPSSRILENSCSRYSHLQFIATATTLVH